MTPPLGPGGHLPTGRHSCSLEEVRDIFVDAPIFQGSTTRSGHFRQLVRYLSAWEAAETAAGGVVLLREVWLAGSFASATLDPDDVDVSPIIDGEVLDSLRGQPGVGRIRRLFEQRDRIVREFGVEPFRIIWRPMVSLDDTRVTPLQRDYLLTRGRYDDLWQRVRTGPSKGPLTLADCEQRRGYLEVKR